MSLKVKLTSTICAFMLILGLMVMGVFASSTATVNLGGSLSFSADNVHARVAGAVSGAENADEVNLPTLTFKEGMTSTEQTQHNTDLGYWGNANLEFTENGDEISIVLTIENLATDRPLYATVNPALTMSNRINSSMLTVSSTTATEGEEYKAGDLIILGAVGGEDPTIAYIRLTMSIKDKNASIPSDETWGYDIDLKDLSAIPTAESFSETFEFLDYSTSAPYTVSVAAAGASEYDYSLGGYIEIPAYIQYNGQVYAVTAIAHEGFGWNDDQTGSSITSITLPNTITFIGDSAFAWCESLESINLPNNLEYIGNYAFAYSHRIESIIIPESVTTIGEGAFTGCNNLTSITIPGSVEIVSAYAFEYCYGLVDVTILSGVKEIGEGAFRYCESLENVVLPEGLEIIGDSSFCGCNSLESVTIPSTVTTIYDYAFDDCENLKTVYVKATTPPEIGSDTISSSVTAIIVPNGTKATYIEEGWADYQYIMFEEGKPTALTVDEWEAREDGNALHFELETIDGVNVASVRGVYDWSDNEEKYIWATYGVVDIPSQVLDSEGNIFTVTSVANFAFLDGEDNGSEVITKVIFPKTIQTIGQEAFYKCEGLTGKLIIPDGVTSIGDSAFSDCTSLTSISIPDSVTSIGDGAFYGCRGLESVVIGDSVTSIGEYAFAGCSGLESVVIGDSVTSIGEYAFSDCSGLKSIDLSNVTSIGEHAFQNCIELKNIDLSSATNIGEQAFYCCEKLSSVVIGVGVTIIRRYTFNNGDSSNTLYYRGTEEQWNAITIEDGNIYVINAKKVFNYTGE